MILIFQNIFLVKKFKNFNFLEIVRKGKKIRQHKEVRRWKNKHLKNTNKKRTDALEAFRNFLKECSKKKFTVQQFLMIGTFAEEEIKKIVANVQIQTTITEDQCDPPQRNLKGRRKM